jgi:hypothetical protein
LVVNERAERPSRRTLLASSGSLALLLAGCSASQTTTTSFPKLPGGVRREDTQILNHLLDLEYRGIAAYTAGIPLLSGRSAMAAKHFLDQELAHAGELSGLIRQAKGKALKQRPGYDLGQPRDGAEVLALLHANESALIAAYLDAIPRLTPGAVRAGVAAVLANDAQHISVLRSLLGKPPWPSAIVSGGQ